MTVIFLLTSLACPPFWDLFGNSCYWFRPKVMTTWHKASEDCEKNRGGYLAKISSSGGEKDFITKKINSSPVTLRNCIVCINHITWFLSVYGA